MELVVVLNGERRTFDGLYSGSTLDLLVATLNLKGDRIAIEHNGAIVARAEWRKAVLADDDRLEIVHFVGGGALVPSYSRAKPQAP